MGCMASDKIKMEDGTPSDMDTANSVERKVAKKSSKAKYKKAPQAPRRFKSAYMFFSTTKHKEIRDDLGAKGLVEKTTNIAKLVSKAWKDLTPEEKDEWEDQARRDKARFEVEKSLYTGPWKVPAKKRSQKDPNAPKRPMSAFLAYSHAKRAEVKKKSPNMNNAEISRVLAQLWKDAPEEEKKEHIEKEYQLRQKYLSEIAVWRENTEKEFNEQRKSREDIAMKTVAARSSARDDDGHDPSTSYEKDRDGDKGAGKYSGYYPPHHLYYAPNAPSQGPYGQEYPPAYAPPSYYHPAPNQHATSEHYEQLPRSSEIAGSQDGDGYNDYYAQAGYGQYPPTGSSSDPYPPGGHEQYPSRGYSGSYAEYPVTMTTGHPRGNVAASYASYYDQHAYPAPPYGDGGYGRDHYPHEPPSHHFYPSTYGDPMSGTERASASTTECRGGESGMKR